MKFIQKKQKKKCAKLCTQLLYILKKDTTDEQLNLKLGAQTKRIYANDKETTEKKPTYL